MSTASQVSTRFRAATVMLLAGGALAACADTPAGPVADPGPLTLTLETASAATVVPCGSEVPASVRVTRNNKGVSGAHLNFRVLAGGGQMYGGSAITNANGDARDIWSLGNVGNTLNRMAVRAVDPATGVATEHLLLERTTATRIAYEVGKQIYTMNPDGSDLRRLTAAGTNNEAPAWSPDGRRIAYAAFHSGVLRLHLMDADGSNVTVFNNTSDVWSTSWSPDGRRIAFGVFGGSFFVINADGTGGTPLGAGHLPAWSPDGSQIAFVRVADGYAIHTAYPDGSNVQRLANAALSAPAWSPDGRRIAFVRSDGSNKGIWVMNANGTSQVRLTSQVEPIDRLSWSADGSQITFAINRSPVGAADWQIDVVDANGANPRHTGQRGRMPSWSGCAP